MGELQIMPYKRKHYSQHFCYLLIGITALISCNGYSVMIPEFEAQNLNFTQLHQVSRGCRGEEGIYYFRARFHLQFF